MRRPFVCLVLQSFRTDDSSFIDKNKITDLAPLVAVCKADAEGKKNFAPYLHLFMKDNPLSDAAKGEQTEALKAIGVRLEMP